MNQNKDNDAFSEEVHRQHHLVACLDYICSQVCCTCDYAISKKQLLVSISQQDTQNVAS